MRNNKNIKLIAAIKKINLLGYAGTPFIFIFDFNLKKPVVLTPEEAAQKNIFFDINGVKNYLYSTEKINFQDYKKKSDRKIVFKKNPETFEVYEKKFDKIISSINYGNSFLANLTCKTPIETNLSLKDIFLHSWARYKLIYKNKYVCFSPETFVKIANGTISTFPMKGTIDATIPDAENIILNDIKEMAEHNTIVDLMRNDLGKICDKVWVKKFRFTDKIVTQNGALLQVISEICGILPKNYNQQLGTLLYSLLPAGSICGAPKFETLRLIAETEDYNRGFYTGIFGIFDGKNLDSGVLIRFIERTPSGFVFKSGGGITAQSDVRTEYEEMIQKIYLPVF